MKASQALVAGSIPATRFEEKPTQRTESLPYPHLLLNIPNDLLAETLQVCYLKEASNTKCRDSSVGRAED
jgi:hypothetical protein